jgi:alpha-beta hydrolase superfamily lysophospholipase
LNPILIVAAVAALIVLGIAGWCAAGIIILLRRSVYPKRVTPQQTPAICAAGCTEVRFPSRGGDARLAGWFVPSQTRPVRGVILCCHGMSQTREQMLPWAESLWNGGFHVLLFDFRAVGESEGHRATGGFMETEDVRGAVEYVVSRPDCAGLKLGVLGFSMGGSSGILAAAEEPRIEAVATHAAYATLDSAIAARCRFHFGILAPIVAAGFKWFGRRHFHAQPAEIVPLRVVSCLSPRPLFVLHGEKDPIVPPQNAYDLYAAAGEPRFLHLLKDGDHEPDHAHTEEVHAEVVGFFQRYLADEECVVSCLPAQTAARV